MASEATEPGRESGKRRDDRRGVPEGTPQEGGASTPLAAPGSFAAATNGYPDSLLRVFVVDEREHLDAPQAAAAAQVGELDHEGAGEHLAAAALDQLDGRRGGAAGGEEVVHDQHSVAGADRVVVDLERVAAVLELVARGVGLGGELAWLAHQRDAGAEPVGHRRADQEAARLDAEHHGRPDAVALDEAVEDRKSVV